MFFRANKKWALAHSSLPSHHRCGHGILLRRNKIVCNRYDTSVLRGIQWGGSADDGQFEPNCRNPSLCKHSTLVGIRRDVLGIDYAEWLPLANSRQSSLWDIPTNETNELFYAKIIDVEGVDVSDSRSAKLSEISGRIAA